MENWNYFNYFTEIEEHFWKKRGAHLLVSPLDWAIMETWQKAGVPLEAALQGIDRAFESYQRSRRGAGKALKSLAYCTDAVLEAAEQRQEAATGAQTTPKAGAKEPFSRDELLAYLRRHADQLQQAATRCESSQPLLATLFKHIVQSIASSSGILETPGTLPLEDLERQLTILDDKIYAALLTHAHENLLLKIRREVDSQLSSYRRKMKADQLALVERQYSQKRLLDEFHLPRLSLYYFS
jgi:hypothetical protein